MKEPMLPALRRGACVALAAGLVLLAACGGGASSGQPSQAVVAAVPLPGSIGSDGTLQWASLAARTYATAAFSPKVSLVGSDGWLGIDSDDALLLTRDDGRFTSLSLYRYTGEVVSDRCVTPATVQPLEGADALVEWVSSYPGLGVVERDPITVGGDTARVLDIVFAGGQRCVTDTPTTSQAILWDGAVQEILTANDRMRVVVIDHRGGPLVVTIRTLPSQSAEPDQQAKVVDLGEFIEMAQPILDSIEFGRGS